MYEKFKSLLHNDQLFYGFLVILVGICSFGLGRASVVPVESQNPPSKVIIEKTQTASAISVSAVGETVTDESTPAASGSVVGSRSGTKYHLPSCPGAGQIKPENRIEFPSAAAAEAAGYTKAANCPGLK